jgi:hypothetical protein
LSPWTVHTDPIASGVDRIHHLADTRPANHFLAPRNPRHLSGVKIQGAAEYKARSIGDYEIKGTPLPAEGFFLSGKRLTASSARRWINAAEKNFLSEPKLTNDSMRSALMGDPNIAFFLA